MPNLVCYVFLLLLYEKSHSFINDQTRVLSMKASVVKLVIMLVFQCTILNAKLQPNTFSSDFVFLRPVIARFKVETFPMCCEFSLIFFVFIFYFASLILTVVIYVRIKV